LATGVRPIRTPRGLDATCLTPLTVAHRVPHPTLLVCLLLAPVHHAPHLCRSLLTPRSSLLPVAHLAPRFSSAPRHPLPLAARAPAQASQGWCWWWWWCSRVTARCRIPLRRPESTGPDLSFPMLQICISSVLDGSQVCCNYYIWMLHILEVFQRHVVSVCSKYFICFRRMLRQVCFSRCCICFTHMLQVFYLDVTYVSDTCCKCFI
jgi:hypothetical protein